MRKRPQPSRLRGLLRALAAAVILILLLLAAILIASSLTAPSANAPTPPNTPAPTIDLTPQNLRTPVTRRATPSHSPTKKAGLGRPAGQHPEPRAVFEQSGQDIYARLGARHAGPRRSATAAPNGCWLAYFIQRGGIYDRNPLYVSRRGAFGALRLGYGDPLVRPAWSPDGRYLVYVRAEATKIFPGTRWLLVRLDLQTRRDQVVARVRALGLTPLGWRAGTMLYLVANPTDTAIGAQSIGTTRTLGVLIPQPIISASLSPDGQFIGFGAPTNCSGCTLDLYDATTGTLWNGPSGMPGESTLAWSGDSKAVVTILGQRLAVVPVDHSAPRLFRLPGDLPHSWIHPMRALLGPDSVRLVDTVTQRTYNATR